MTFIDVTCMSDRSEEVIIETFPRRNDTPFFTTRSCRLDTLHPNSCFCSFPSLHLKYFRIKFLVCVIVYKPFHNCFFLIYKIYPVTVYSVCVYVCTTVYVYMPVYVCMCV